LSAFEYLSVFISIILGLAVVHLLGGVSLIIDQRVRARLDAIHLLWVMNMFTLITWVWWGNWQLNDVVAFSSVHYIAMVLFSVVVYLMCGLLFPVRGKEVEDFHEQFEMNRSRFFYLGLALSVAALLKGHVDRQVLEEPDTLERAIALGIVAASFVLAAHTRHRHFHTLLAVLFLLLLLRLIFTE
jgi:putative Mn2+ efflux pump MntP